MGCCSGSRITDGCGCPPFAPDSVIRKSPAAAGAVQTWRFLLARSDAYHERPLKRQTAPSQEGHGKASGLGGALETGLRVRGTALSLSDAEATHSPSSEWEQQHDRTPCPPTARPLDPQVARKLSIVTAHLCSDQAEQGWPNAVA